MDPNLLYWKNQGQSFFSRLRIWFDLLDPLSLLSSEAEILKSHKLLESGETLRKEDGHAPNLSLSAVHPDSGDTIPVVYRPAALFLFSTPLVIASFLPHNSIKHALYWQSLQQCYYAGFNHANKNSSAGQSDIVSEKQLLLFTGTVSFTACAGALPQILINRFGVGNIPLQTFLKSTLPIPLSAALAAFNVFAVRSDELQTGIKVFDSNGNPVGFSKAAGKKAIKETASSRAVLFCTTATVPGLLDMSFSKYFEKKTLLVSASRHGILAVIFGLMIPVSFSLYPQLGTIKKEHVEEELKAAAVDGQLYYHRGL